MQALLEHDLTVVVTTHREGRLLRPTLRSIEAALGELSSGSAELLLVCDNADDRTRQEVDRWVDDRSLRFPVRSIEVHLGESGASRNAGAVAARGEFVAFVDGDDIISANYFSGALSVLRDATAPLIVHPEYIVSFGARSLLWRTESARAHDISYRDLVRHNVWPSSAVTRRSVYLAHPYRSLPPELGYGPEDWIWNIDTSAAGISHDVVPETVFFYRVRESGGVNNRHSVSILPPFDLDGLRHHLPVAPGSPPTVVRGLRGLLATTYSALRPAISRATGWLSHDARRFLYQSARWTARTMTGRGRAQPSAHETPAFVTAALRAACELDPAISWTANSFADLPIWTARDDGYTEIIETALDGIVPGGAIVAVPWVGVGGADLVSVNYARALDASTAFRGRTTILGTFLTSRTRADMLPEGIPYLHLDERWLAFPTHVRRRLIAQIIVMARPSLLVSVNSFHVTEALRSHSAQMLDGTRIYSTLFAFDRIGDGFPVNPITDDSQRDYLDEIDGLITDNTTTARLITEILALPPEQILVHRQPVGRSSSSSTAAWADGSFSPETPFRLVWPHRLDEEKRPDALVAIAEELRRRGAPARIEVWGQRVLSSDGDALLRRFRDAGIAYHGPYSGGLTALDTDGYHGLLLTSKSEGLPLILVQALHAGLPVVASGVGGVPDIIRDGETGLLTSGPDDASGFADAIQTLMDDLELRRRLIRQGAEFAAANHSWERFAEVVDRAFGS